MNLGELEKEVRKMRAEGHGDNVEVVVVIPSEKDGGLGEQREPMNLHYASGAIWMPLKQGGCVESREL